MLDIYIDADACPVKAETLKVAERHQLHVYVVSNAWLRPSGNPNIDIIHVETTPDAADHWIVGRIGEGDIVITADILLAGRCLKNKAKAIGHTGKLFTDDNIGNAVAGRSLSSHLRELGEESGRHPSFSQQDRSRFLQMLEETVQTIKRTR